jgi:hypothetical protein
LSVVDERVNQVKKTLSLLVALLIGMTLVACGGGGSDAPVPVQVAKADTDLPAAPTTVAAVANTPFAFSAGVASFGTTATTTLAFTDTSDTPAFSIASGGNTATGTTTFGSCDFLIKASTFPASSPLAVGKTIVVNPCHISVDTQGQAANGQGQPRDTCIWLGTLQSSYTPITVSINPGGQITLNGKSVGTVTLAPITGGG